MKNGNRVLFFLSIGGLLLTSCGGSNSSSLSPSSPSSEIEPSSSSEISSSSAESSPSKTSEITSSEPELSPEPSSSSSHEHTFEEGWTYNDDYHWHKATCEHTTEVIGKEEHSLTLTGEVQPTYDTDGSKTYVCDICGYERVETVDKLNFTRVDVPETYNFDAIVSDGVEDIIVSDVLTEFDEVKIRNYDDKTVYENRLEMPNHDVTTLDEFSDVLDYHAFYGDDSTFIVHVSQYPKASRSIINSAFYNSKLCPGIVGLNYGYDTKSKSFSIQMLFNEDAANYKAKWVNSVNADPVSILYSFPSEVGDRSSDFEDFPYLEKNDKGVIDVYNSDQLLYALEFGYLPNILPDSPAEILMAKAKEILRDIIKDDMTNNDKIAAIYTYLTTHCSYDTTGDVYATYTVERKKYPDYLASTFRSFYAEGSLIDGLCVCQGYAKGFNILANIEGITSIKVSARYDSDTQSICSTDYSAAGGTYLQHGYCYTLNEDNGKYYICDPTYALYGKLNHNNRLIEIYRRYAAMLNYGTWSNLYSRVVDRFHTRRDVAKTYLDFSPYIKMGNLSFQIDTIAELGDYLKALVEFASTYNDPSFKTNADIFQVNLTVKEVDGNTNKLYTLATTFWNEIEKLGYEYPDVRCWYENYYTYSSNAGLLFTLIFK